MRTLVCVGWFSYLTVRSSAYFSYSLSTVSLHNRCNYLSHKPSYRKCSADNIRRYSDEDVPPIVPLSTSSTNNVVPISSPEIIPDISFIPFSISSSSVSTSKSLGHHKSQSFPSTQTQSSNTKLIFGMNEKLRKRWMTGLSLGAIATLWIFSGNGYFTLGILLTTVMAQMEYYKMVRNTGVDPAIKTGLLSSLMCYITAAMAPQFHEFVMPLAATQLMLWLLVFNKKAALISEISTTFLGIFFFGYMPSFWVRLRALGEISPTLFPVILQSWGWTRADTWTQGAVVTWWTWTSTVFADVGAYFIGKKYGKHKLSTISAAAGSASPNKTVEGALAGFVSCTSLSLLGAWLMQWPYWAITGGVYGLLISFVALIGDLTASMMKRDAKMKDSGSILPGHGGLLDRFDSYILTAPFAYLFCTLVLPFAKRVKLENIKLAMGI